jgi:hypothetical protein
VDEAEVGAESDPYYPNWSAVDEQLFQRQKESPFGFLLAETSHLFNDQVLDKKFVITQGKPF